MAQEHVPFEVVPGVSSATAVPAYAGIPVTHRRLAAHFTVVTGHDAVGSTGGGVRWEDLAAQGGTLVILMGMGNVSEIAGRLVEGGLPSETPVAAIAEGTWPGQQTVTGTLADIADRAVASGLKPPAVIVVGEVVNLHQKLRWFDRLPLFGKRVLVTRAPHQAGPLVRLLSDRGAMPVEMPVMAIEEVSDTAEVDKALRNLDSYDWVLLTSANGVEAFFRRLGDLGLDARALKDVKVGAIGPATAEALEQHGIRADFVPDVYTSEGLVAGLADRQVAGCRFLLPRADIAGRTLTEGIARLGAEAHEIAMYRTVMPPEVSPGARRMIVDGDIDVITLASPSAVANLMTIMGEQRGFVQRATIACIGPVTAEAAADLGLTVDIVAGEHTIAGLVEAMEDYFGTGGRSAK